MPRYNNVNTASTVSQMSSGNANVYSYGNYYTWTAANAMTNTTTSGNTSICPKGWRLPTGTSTGEFYQLHTLNNASTYANTRILLSFPNNFVLSGAVYSGNISSRGEVPGYWSKTNIDSANSYVFTPTNNDTFLQKASTALGHPIRCIIN